MAFAAGILAGLIVANLIPAPTSCGLKGNAAAKEDEHTGAAV
jgi:hypothetical protein